MLPFQELQCPLTAKISVNILKFEMFLKTLFIITLHFLNEYILDMFLEMLWFYYSEIVVVGDPDLYNFKDLNLIPDLVSYY